MTRPIRTFSLGLAACAAISAGAATPAQADDLDNALRLLAPVIADVVRVERRFDDDDGYFRGARVYRDRDDDDWDDWDDDDDDDDDDDWDDD